MIHLRVHGKQRVVTREQVHMAGRQDSRLASYSDLHRGSSLHRGEVQLDVDFSPDIISRRVWWWTPEEGQGWTVESFRSSDKFKLLMNSCETLLERLIAAGRSSDFTFCHWFPFGSESGRDVIDLIMTGTTENGWFTVRIWCSALWEKVEFQMEYPWCMET